MKRRTVFWGALLALMLSLGVNLGLLVSRFLPSGSTEESPTPAAERPGNPLDPGPAVPAAPPELPRAIGRMADELGLEGEQREAFLSLQRRFFQDTVTGVRRMSQLQRRLRHEVLAQEPDREVIDRLLREVARTQMQLERAFVVNLLDARQLLDDEQERRYMHHLQGLRRMRGELEQRLRGQPGRGVGPGPRGGGPQRPPWRGGGG